MGYQVVTGDARTAALTGASGQDSNMMDDTVNKTFSDEDGIVARIGRGETNPLITYLSLFNDAGVECFLYPNADGNGVIVQTVKP